MAVKSPGGREASFHLELPALAVIESVRLLQAGFQKVTQRNESRSTRIGDANRGAQMAEKYTDEILKYVRMYSTSAKNNAAILDIDAGPVLGSILEEANDRFGGTFNPNRFLRPIGDAADFIFNTSHENILSDYNEVKALGAAWRVNLSDPEKLTNPIMLGQGIGYIKGYTAIDLLEKYNQEFPDSDPLDLKGYNGNYDKLFLALSDSHDNTTVKFASLMVKEAYSWGSNNISDWSSLSRDEKGAFAVYYYNVGEDNLNIKKDQAIAKNGKYSPDLKNTDIAQEYLANKDKIKAQSESSIVNLSGLRELIANGDLNVLNKDDYGAGTGTNGDMRGTDQSIQPNADVEELRKHGGSGDAAKGQFPGKSDRPSPERIDPKKGPGKGERSGESDLNGPEGKVFDVPNGRKRTQHVPRSPGPRQARSGGKSGTRKGVERGGNPFDLKSPDLHRQAEIVEGDPQRARMLIRQAKRRPELFNL